MKRIVYFALSLGTAGLMIMLLVMTIGAQPTDLADVTVIQVPDDYPTIQAAIDAATTGDTIQVTAGTYKGNLSISEGFTNNHPVSGYATFVDVANHDYQLALGSAAIDTGDPAGVPPAPDQDADGLARPKFTAVDIGAYEWQGDWHYLPVVANSFASRTGWAIGYSEGGAAIVHTSNSGLTWELQGDWSGLVPGDISAVDDQTAWAALGGNALLYTTDGGATWVNQTIPADISGGMKSVKGLSRDEAWAASLGGEILHTTDGGANWNLVPHPSVPIVQVNRMDVIGSQVWIADSDSDGAVVHTPDGGQTWRVENLPRDDSPLTVHAYSRMAVWGSGTKSLAFYRTVDGGDQWTVAKEVGGFDHLDDVCATSRDDAWGVQNGDGVSGDIWRVHVTDDGTAEAKKVSPPELSNYMPGGVSCLGTDEAWVVAAEGIHREEGAPLGKIFHTLDGENWVQQPAPPDIRYWKVSFAGARR